MSATPPLDAIDYKLLRLVQEDVTLSINDLGEQVNLSQNACWRRIKRLESDGYIRRKVALLDADKLGCGVTVFVSIRAAEHSEHWLAELAAAVQNIPEIVEFYRMSGDVDYLMKVKVRDISAYDIVYKKLIGQVRISNVSSAFTMEEIKHTTSIPLLT